jgi:hypothetical protein
MRIHAIDIDQPPGIGILPIADVDPHQSIVSAALPAKSSADIAKNACREDRTVAMDWNFLFPSDVDVVPI